LQKDGDELVKNGPDDADAQEAKANDEGFGVVKTFLCTCFGHGILL
jgi:hypothetical protein